MGIWWWSGWWFGPCFIFHDRMSSFPLTNSYFSRWLNPPTSNYQGYYWDLFYLFIYLFIYIYNGIWNLTIICWVCFEHGIYKQKNNAIKRVGSWWFPSVDWGQESIFLGIDVLNGRILGLGCGYCWNRYQKDKLRHGVACAKFDSFWTMVFWWCMADSLGEY